MNVTLDSPEKLCDALKVDLPALLMTEPSLKVETEKTPRARLKALIEKKN